MAMCREVGDERAEREKSMCQWEGSRIERTSEEKEEGGGRGGREEEESARRASSHKALFILLNQKILGPFLSPLTSRPSQKINTRKLSQESTVKAFVSAL